MFMMYKHYANVKQGGGGVQMGGKGIHGEDGLHCYSNWDYTLMSCQVGDTACRDCSRIPLGDACGGAHVASICCPSLHKLLGPLQLVCPETPHCGGRVHTKAAAVCLLYAAAQQNNPLNTSESDEFSWMEAHALPDLCRKAEQVHSDAWCKVARRGEIQYPFNSRVTGIVLRGQVGVALRSTWSPWAVRVSHAVSCRRHGKRCHEPASLRVSTEFTYANAWDTE